jgi:glycerophosphoryl diester phosphodiesterase
VRNDVGLAVIAHRAGNDLRVARSALDSGVDLVEADVHLFRGRLEVRHHKSLGPWLLWEKWKLNRRGSVAVPELSQLIRAMGDDDRLMLDLKGVHPWLARRVAGTLQELAPGTPFTVCTQHWWMLPAFKAYPHIRVVLSAGSSRALRRLLRRLRTTSAYGVSVDRRLLTRESVARLRRATEVVMTWPVDTPDSLTHARHLGVGAVISKNPMILGGVSPRRGL